jgi:hypothetical protein
MGEVRRLVAERTGHLLRSEVRLVGFPDDQHERERGALFAGVSW